MTTYYLKTETISVEVDLEDIHTSLNMSLSLKQDIAQEALKAIYRQKDNDEIYILLDNSVMQRYLKWHFEQ